MTKRVLENVKKAGIETGDGPSSPLLGPSADSADLDGFEDMPDDAKAKIEEALKTGEVDPADIPESAKKQDTDENAEEDEEPKAKKPAPKVRRAHKSMSDPRSEAREEGRRRR